MDGRRFDRLARTVAGETSRRRVIAGLAGAALAALGLGRARAQQTSDSLVDFTGLFCGGIAGVRCPGGYECDDDPGDSCDSTQGGADCGGHCRRVAPPITCASVLCIEGTHCCDNCGDPICVPLGTSCSDDLCESEPCGGNFCGPGEFCCNPSCGICAPLGGVCTLEFCGGEPCNQTVCGAGEYCCNFSCSMCAPIGGACPELFCDDAQPCGDNFCGPGEYCCNASCGICAPLDGACIQIACL